MSCWNRTGKFATFFQGNEPKRDEGRDITVSVRVESQKHAEPAVSIDGRSITRPLRNALSTTVEIHRAERPSYSRALAEAVRFLIAFGVALAGLLSGALQQLEKLDFLPAMIAVLAIGFGADTIKTCSPRHRKRPRFSPRPVPCTAPANSAAPRSARLKCCRWSESLRGIR